MDSRQTATLQRHPREAVRGRSASWLGGVTLILWPLVACGGHKMTSDEPEPIPRVPAISRSSFGLHIGQNLPISHETQMMPENERAQARTLCAVNLRRIKIACR